MFYSQFTDVQQATASCQVLISCLLTWRPWQGCPALQVLQHGKAQFRPSHLSVGGGKVPIDTPFEATSPNGSNWLDAVKPHVYCDATKGCISTICYNLYQYSERNANYFDCTTSPSVYCPFVTTDYVRLNSEDRIWFARLWCEDVGYGCEGARLAKSPPDSLEGYRSRCHIITLLYITLPFLK